MDDHTYGVSEIVGSSATSIEDAVRTAVEKAGEDRRNIRWFEVTQVRGHVQDGQGAHFQGSLKLGYTLEG